MTLNPLSKGFVWSPTRGPFRRLTAERAQAFDERGYLHFEHELCADEVAELTSEIEALAARADVDREPSEVMYTDHAHTSYVLKIASRSTRVRSICFSPRLRDLVHDLVGPDAWMHYDHSIYKKPGGRLPLFWHQDNAYPFVEPQQRRVTFWLALTDMTDEDGCLWVQPGGHRMGTFAHENDADGWRCFDEAPPGAVQLDVSAGDLVVYSSLMPHFSGPNRARSTRKAYALWFVPEGACAVQVLDGEALRLPCDNGVHVLAAGSPPEGS